MKPFRDPATRAGILIILLGWIVMFAAVSALRPLMPIDETRYLTVAWEMHEAGRWILPTLNYEPYSHKPPLIFWLIRGSWEIFGISITAARLVIFAFVLAFLALTARLARALYPDRQAVAIMAALCMSAMPVYLVYGSVIMFDSMLAAFAMIGIVAIWRAAEKDSIKNWLILGAAIGLGVLSKGPVVLVYTLPTALLAPLWIENRIVNWRQWYAGLFMAFTIGLAIALSWALPAAAEGGPLYAQRIFYTQSAGRMINAFDHREPFWFYAPVILGFMLPLLSWPALWDGARRTFRLRQAEKFLLCWIVPCFLFFTAISSKSFHYVIPFLPGAAILAAAQIERNGIRNPKWLALPLFVMLIPSIVVLIFEALHMPFARMKLKEASEHLGYVHIAISAGIYWWARKDAARSLRGLAMGSFLLAVMIHAQLAQEFLPHYDLRPIARELHKYEGRPWASAPKYDGEYGFLARTDNLFIPIGREEVGWWLDHNRNGIVIGRYSPRSVPADQYTILFRQPFRTNEVLVIMEAKDAPATAPTAAPATPMPEVGKK